MPKKRKTQLKPVARGFATTSIPKKVIQTEEIPPPTDEVPSDGLVIEAAEAAVDHQAVVLRGVSSESDSKLVVEQDEQQPFLQFMVDKFQERTEKEISRTIKVCSPTPCHPLQGL